MRLIVFALLVAAASCSGPAPASKSSSPVPPPSHERPSDLSTKFPSAGQLKMQLVPDHLLDKDFMPGGNLADYKTPAGEYQMFLMATHDAHAAAYNLLDWKTAIPDAKYLPNMGGYFGLDHGKPVFVFAKGAYLAGIVGLPEAKADPIARVFAARL